MGLEMEGLKPELGVSKGFSYAEYPTLPYQGGIRSKVAGAETLRVQFKLVPFPLSVCSPPSQYWHFCPRGEQCWSKNGGKNR